MKGHHNNKGIEFQYSFFVVLGNGPTLLGKPVCEKLQLLSISYNTMYDEQKGRQINEKQDKSKIKKNLKTNPHHNNKIEKVIDHFIF